jgi:hypothetical protein
LHCLITNSLVTIAEKLASRLIKNPETIGILAATIA